MANYNIFQGQTINNDKFHKFLEEGKPALPVIKIDDLENHYSKLVSNPDFRNWREAHIHCMRVYAGVTTFDKEVLIGLKKRGIPRTTANIVAPIVDALCGIELQNKSRFKVSLATDREEGQDIEEALNQYLFDFQNQSEIEEAFNLSLKDAIIGGLGFTEVRYENHRPFLGYINPLQIVFDANDSSASYTKQYEIFTWDDLPIMEIKRLFGRNCGLRFDEYDYYTHHKKDYLSESLFCDNDRRVFTCKRIEIVDGWEGIGLDGVKTQTVNKYYANLLSDVKKIEMPVVTTTYICQGKIIRRKIDDPICLTWDLPISILVFQKDADFVPRGLVRKIDDLQFNVNAALSKHAAFADAEKIFVKTDNGNLAREILDNPGQLQAPHSVTVLAREDNVIFSRQSEAMSQQSQIVSGLLDLIKKSSGVEDETRGIPTNANSGIAQRMRDMTSIRTNAFVFERFSNYKKKVGEKVLQQLQSSCDTNIIVNLSDPDKKRSIILNYAIPLPDGSYELRNDITKKQWNIVVEECPLFTQNKQARQAELERLFSLPFAEQIIHSEKLLGLYTDTPRKIRKELLEYEQQQAMIEQMNPQNNSGMANNGIAQLNTQNNSGIANYVQSMQNNNM